MIAQIISTCTRLHPPLTDKSCWFAESVWSGEAMALYIGSEPQENRLEGKHLVIRAAMEVAMAPSQHSNSSKCAWGRVVHVVAILLASVTMTLAAPAADSSREQVVSNQPRWQANALVFKRAKLGSSGTQGTKVGAG
jgi:hypothetical protein